LKETICADAASIDLRMDDLEGCVKELNKVAEFVDSSSFRDRDLYPLVIRESLNQLCASLKRIIQLVDDLPLSSVNNKSDYRYIVPLINIPIERRR